MRRLIIPAVILISGCARDAAYQVAGSVSYEADRPEGKAVGKVEVRYTPPPTARPPNPAPDGRGQPGGFAADAPRGDACR